MSHSEGNSGAPRGPRETPARPGDFKMSDAQRRGNLVILELSGRLDGHAAQLLQQRCAEIRNQGHTHLALELGGISFLASSGLGVFLAETEEFKEACGSLHLVGPSSVVASVVGLLNVGRFLSILPSLEDLVASMDSR